MVQPSLNGNRVLFPSLPRTQSSAPCRRPLRGLLIQGHLQRVFPQDLLPANEANFTRKTPPFGLRKRPCR